MPEVCTKLTNGEEDFASCPNISIDYGIMEKANNVFVQLCDFGWARFRYMGRPCMIYHPRTKKVTL